MCLKSSLFKFIFPFAFKLIHASEKRKYANDYITFSTV